MKDPFMRGSSKELIAFAYIHEDYQKTGDIMKGLMPLFAPIIHERSGLVFNASEFAKAVQEKYDIAMRPIVAEGLIPKLVESELLTKEEKNKYVAIYRYATGPEARILPRDDSFDAVLDEFCSFAEEALSQQKLSAVRETLKNAFLERLKSMEILHTSELSPFLFYMLPP